MSGGGPGGMMGPGGGGPGSVGGGPGGMMGGPGGPMGGGGGKGGYTGSPGGGMMGGGQGGYQSGPGGPAGGYGQGGYTGQQAPGGGAGGQYGPVAGSDPGAYGPSTALAGNISSMQGGDITAIEKKIKWRLFFFGGACCVLFAAVVAVFHFIISFADVSHWSPCTFLSCTFLMVFGLLMMVLDLPVPSPNAKLQSIREHIYQLALFLTRFTGRGMWYIFLGTHVWVALYDDSINPFFGIVFTIYLVLLGIAALVKGISLSRKLNGVRQALKDTQRPENFIARGQQGMTVDQFAQMVATVMVRNDYFTPDELGYIVNALSFTPRSDNIITLEEYEYWMKDGPMSLGMKDGPMLLV